MVPSISQFFPSSSPNQSVSLATGSVQHRQHHAGEKFRVDDIELITTATDATALLRHSLESRKSDRYVYFSLDVVTRLCEDSSRSRNSGSYFSHSQLLALISHLWLLARHRRRIERTGCVWPTGSDIGIKDQLSVVLRSLSASYLLFVVHFCGLLSESDHRDEAIRASGLRHSVSHTEGRADAHSRGPAHRAAVGLANHLLPVAGAIRCVILG